MSQETKVLIGIGIATLGVFGAIIFFNSQANTQGVTSLADQALLIGENSSQTGPKESKATLVEFSDFQCPACGAAFKTTQQIQLDYKDKVNFVYRHFPLETIHKNAFTAALASESAGAQGKFWEMHDKLFEKQEEWSTLDNPMDKFVTYAQEIGLDVDKFKDSVTKKEFESKIRGDQQNGNQLRVDRTPTFYFNGKKLDGIPSYPELKTLFENALVS